MLQCQLLSEITGRLRSAFLLGESRFEFVPEGDLGDGEREDLVSEREKSSLSLVHFLDVGLKQDFTIFPRFMDHRLGGRDGHGSR